MYPAKLSFAVSGIGYAAGACLGPLLDAPIVRSEGARHLVPGVKLK